MRRTRIHWILALTMVLTATIPATAQDWAGGGRVRGVVYSEADEPIEGAEIRLKWGENEEGGPEPVFTDKKGRWSYIGLKPGFWFFEIYLDGYRPYREQIEVFQTTLGEAAKVTLREVSQEVKDARRREVVNERLAKGIELGEAGDLVGAREVFEAALPKMTEEEQPMVLTGIADTYVREGNHESGIEYLDRALAIDEDFTPALRLMVAVLIAEDREADAQAYMAKMPEGADLDPNSELNLGIMRYNEGDMDAAAVIFERLVNEHPDIAEAQYFSGIVHLNQGKNAEALAEFQRMLELAPSHEKADEVKGFIEYLETTL